MSSLTDFHLERIAEDEAQARRAIADRDDIEFIEPPEVPDLSFVAWEDLAVPAVVVGPERVLAECEAKRRIVEEHREQAGGGCAVCSRHEYPCPTLRLLALPYADHPDYREEWRP